MSETKHRISLSGTGALLLDVAGAEFDLQLQTRLVSLARSLREEQSQFRVLEVVPGVNNLLLVFDPLAMALDDAYRLLTTRWTESRATLDAASREFEIPVVYGGEDISKVAAGAHISEEEVIQRHAAARYVVACVGGYPGFPYLAGLPDALKTPRRAVPRARLDKGAVIIGGAQAGVMPCAGPSGWHVIGNTEVSLFSPDRHPPCLLRAGDRIRFLVSRQRP